jgi:hypothetical protein
MTICCDTVLACLESCKLNLAVVVGISVLQ